MSKSIKYWVDQLNKRIVLLESGNKDDYLDLKCSEIDLINQQNKSQYRFDIINEFKNGDEYCNLVNENSSLKNQLSKVTQNFQLKLTNEIQNQELKLNKEHQEQLRSLINENKQEMNAKNDEISQLKIDKIRLQEQLNSYNQIKKNEQERLFAELTNQYVEKINKLVQEKSNQVAEFAQREKEWIQKADEEKKQWSQKYNELSNKYEAINRERALIASVKEFGEDLENWCANKFEELHTNDMSDGFDCTFEKINEALSLENDLDCRKTKADFLFTVYAKPVNFRRTSENKEGIKEILRVVVEMKTQLLSTKEPHKKKNESHLNKLIKDMKTQKAQYGLLVSELEMEQNWLIKKFIHLPNLFAIRPAYFISMLSLIRTFAKRKYELEQKLEQKETSILKRDELIKEFEKFKDGLLKLLIDKLNDKANEIVQKADRIEKMATDISLLGRKIIQIITDDVRRRIDEFRLIKNGTFKNAFELIAKLEKNMPEDYSLKTSK